MLALWYDFAGDQEILCHIQFDGSCWWLSMEPSCTPDKSVIFGMETAARIIPFLHTLVAWDRQVIRGGLPPTGVWVSGGDYDGIHGQSDIAVEAVHPPGHSDGEALRFRAGDGENAREVHIDIDQAWWLLAAMEEAMRLKSLFNLSLKTWR